MLPARSLRAPPFRPATETQFRQGLHSQCPTLGTRAKYKATKSNRLACKAASASILIRWPSVGGLIACFASSTVIVAKFASVLESCDGDWCATSESRIPETTILIFMVLGSKLPFRSLHYLINAIAGTSKQSRQWRSGSRLQQPTTTQAFGARWKQQALVKKNPRASRQGW